MTLIKAVVPNSISEEDLVSAEAQQDCRPQISIHFSPPRAFDFMLDPCSFAASCKTRKSQRTLSIVQKKKKKEGKKLNFWAPSSWWQTKTISVFTSNQSESMEETVLWTVSFWWLIFFHLIKIFQAASQLMWSTPIHVFSLFFRIQMGNKFHRPYHLSLQHLWCNIHGQAALVWTQEFILGLSGFWMDGCVSMHVMGYSHTSLSLLAAQSTSDSITGRKKKNQLNAKQTYLLNNWGSQALISIEALWTQSAQWQEAHWTASHRRHWKTRFTTQHATV